jgi:hypothetical protein
MEICRYVFACNIFTFLRFALHYFELNAFFARLRNMRNTLNMLHNERRSRANPKRDFETTLIEIILKLIVNLSLSETSRRIIKSLLLRCSKYVQNHQLRRLPLRLRFTSKRSCAFKLIGSNK